MHCRRHHPDGRRGRWPVGYGSPSSAPLLEISAGDVGNQGREGGDSRRVALKLGPHDPNVDGESDHETDRRRPELADGPPYTIEELLFDENEVLGCSVTRPNY